MKPLRVLGRLRLSVDRDSSTSIERQRDHVEQWAAREGASVVGWAVDNGVSGIVDPFKTPDLGPWLQHPKQDQWDIMVARDQDRVTRGGVLDLAPVLKWLQQNGKHLAFTHETTDTRSMGLGDRIQMWVKAEVAAEERDKMVQRQIDSQATLRKVGRYRGGPVPYGYQKVKRTEGWGLEINPEERDIIVEAIDKYMNGMSLRQLARELNERRIPSPKSRAIGPKRQERLEKGEPPMWAPAALSQLLRSRALIGQSTHNGAVVLGEDGTPVQRAEPLITEERWRNLQTIITQKAGKPRTSSPTPGLLLDILFCATCQGKLYFSSGTVTRSSGKKTLYRYWRCRNATHPRTDQDGITHKCLEPYVHAEIIEPKAVGIFEMEIGHYRRTKLVLRPAEGPGEDLDRVESNIDTLRKEKFAGHFIGHDDDYMEIMGGLVATRNRLQEIPNKPARWERVPADGTWSDALRAAEAPQAKRQIMLDAGFRISVSQRGTVVDYTFDPTIRDENIPDYDPNYYFDAEAAAEVDRITREYRARQPDEPVEPQQHP